jgi:hypothetical protein
MCSSYFQYKGIILYGDHNPVTTELLISEHALQKKDLTGDQKAESNPTCRTTITSRKVIDHKPTC